LPTIEWPVEGKVFNICLTSDCWDIPWGWINARCLVGKCVNFKQCADSFCVNQLFKLVQIYKSVLTLTKKLMKI